MAALYHARIYDPETGRFLQPDPVHSENAGFDSWDRYAYVNGNPVNFTDPSGNSTNYGHMVNQIMKNTFHSFNHFTKGAIHSSNSFVKGAVHSFNYLVPHEDRTLGSDIERGLKTGLAAFGFGMAILGGGWAVLGLSFLVDPAFTLGFGFSVLNYGAGLVGWAAGRIAGQDVAFPSISFRGGGIIVTGGLVPKGAGISLGPFANLDHSPSEAAIQHELAHVRQYEAWGGWRYLSHTWMSPYLNFTKSKQRLWAENDADRRAGTDAYGGNNWYSFQRMLVLEQAGMGPRDNYAAWWLADRWLADQRLLPGGW